MGSSFAGWGSSWGDHWGPLSSDPNAMVANGGFNLTATAQASAALFSGGQSAWVIDAAASLVASAWLSGYATVSLTATGELTNGAPISGDISATAAFALLATGDLTDANSPASSPQYGNAISAGGADVQISMKEYLRRFTIAGQKSNGLPPAPMQQTKEQRQRKQHRTAALACDEVLFDLMDL